MVCALGTGWDPAVNFPSNGCLGGSELGEEEDDGVDDEDDDEEYDDDDDDVLSAFEVL